MQLSARLFRPLGSWCMALHFPFMCDPDLAPCDVKTKGVVSCLDNGYMPCAYGAMCFHKPCKCTQEVHAG